MYSICGRAILWSLKLVFYSAPYQVSTSVLLAQFESIHRFKPISHEIG